MSAQKADSAAYEDLDQACERMATILQDPQSDCVWDGCTTGTQTKIDMQQAAALVREAARILASCIAREGPPYASQRSTRLQLIIDNTKH